MKDYEDVAGGVLQAGKEEPDLHWDMSVKQRQQIASLIYSSREEELYCTAAEAPGQWRRHLDVLDGETNAEASPPAACMSGEALA